MTSNHSTAVLAESTRPTADELIALHSLLIEQRTFRRQQLAELRRPGRLAACSDPQVTRTLVHGARSALHDVEQALARMQAGTYGACVECGAAVERERLEVIPQVARCLTCHRASHRAATGRAPRG